MIYQTHLKTQHEGMDQLKAAVQWGGSLHRTTIMWLFMTSFYDSCYVRKIRSHMTDLDILNMIQISKGIEDKEPFHNFI